MKTHEHIHDVYVPTADGQVARFPVSRHVLPLSRLKKATSWRPSLAQKASSLVLMLALFASSYGVTYGKLDTIAYFRDDEVSRNNVLQAGALDFTVSPDGDIVALIEAGQHITLPIMTPEPGTFPTMYRVVATTTEPIAPLCEALAASATTSPFIYSGNLLDLSVVATTTSGTWPLEISLPSAAGLANGDQCVVELVYNGWHKDMPENTGYTDEERYLLTITYTDEELIDFNIVLNEFLPNPDDEANGFDFGSDSSDMPDGEWVELYNNGDMPLDIAGWYLSDASGGLGNQQAVIGTGNTQPATTTIPAHGWLVVYFNKPVLNNTGDSIFLYTNNDVLVDSYSYGNPSDFCELELTPGNTNSTSTPSGTPDDDCVDNQVAPNKSYARIPDGTGEWVDPIPTPGAFNIPDPIPEPEPEIAGAAKEPEPSGGGGGADTPVPEVPMPEEENTGTTTPEEAVEEETPETTPEENIENDTASTTPEQPADTPPPQEEPAEMPQPEPEQSQENGDAPADEESTEPPSPVDVPPPPAEDPPLPPPAEDAPPAGILESL